MVILLLSVAYLNANSDGLIQKSKVQNYNYLKKTSTPTPLPRPTAKPKVKGSITSTTPTIDPDPFVNCQIHEKCGGGTKYVRKSVCDTSTYCCFLKDGTSKLMTKYECDNYYGSNTQDKKSTVTLESRYNYEPNYSYPSCTIYYAALGYSKTYYIDTETCNQWKKEQEQSNQEYYDIQQKNSSIPTPTVYDYTQENLEYCKRVKDELTQQYGQEVGQSAYNGCLQGHFSGYSGDSGSIYIEPPKEKEETNYEGTIVY